MDSKTRELSDEEANKLGSSEPHYRAFVGPPQQYDFMGATQFRLLCSLGLREHHKMLDFGCGSLRAGRLFIPYLAPGGYFGIEPNAWLIEDAIKRQIGQDAIYLKRPTFSNSDAFDAGVFGESFDFIVAQSIFSHAGPGILRKALTSFDKALRPGGICLVTIVEDDCDTPEGWHYRKITPEGSVRYRPSLFRQIATEVGFKFVRLPWFHPRQAWWLLGHDLPPEEHLALLHGAVLRDAAFTDSVKNALNPRPLATY